MDKVKSIKISEQILKSNQPGFILASAMVIMGVLFLLSMAMLDFLHNENQLVTGQKLAMKTYYLAEAAQQYAFWRVRTDPNLQNDFKTNPNWQINFTQDGILASSSGYSVTVQNQDLAQGIITATATLQIAGFSSQRVVKNNIFEAIAPYQATATTILIDDGLTFNGADVTANRGDMFSNNNILVTGFSTINANNGLKSAARITINLFSTVNGQKNSSNFPPAAENRSLPQVDFDSESEQSLLNQAANVYSQDEFDTLINASDNITFNDITYVHGSINIPRGKIITVNGVLAADHNISLGTDAEPAELNGPTLYVHHTAGRPSGLLAKQNITFGNYLNLITFDGVIYALNSLNFSNNDSPWVIDGALYSQHASFSSVWQPLTINYSREVAGSVFGGNAAPMITTGYWEEEY